MPRSSRWMGVLAASIGAGAVLASVHLRPTGGSVIDVLLVIVGVATVIVSVRVARRRDLLIASTVVALAAIILLQPIAMVLAGGAIVAATQQNRTTVRGWDLLVGAAVFAASARLGSGPMLGSTAIVALLAILPLIVGAAASLDATARRRVGVGAASLAVLTMLCVAGFGVASFRSIDDLERSESLLRRGLRELDRGEYDASEATFEEVDRELSDVRARVGGVAGQPARMVPVVAQNRRAVLQSLDGTIDVIRAARIVATEGRGLEVSDSTVDLDVVERLGVGITDLAGAVDRYTRLPESDDMTWVVGPVRRKLDDALEQIDDYSDELETIDRVVTVLPTALGRDGPQHYFIGFMTQAETRGLGGFIGNFAILTADRGRLDLTEFGRSDDLVDRSPIDGLSIELDQAYLDRYGPFNFESPRNGHVQPAAWKNVALSPDFETVAQLIATMYPEIEDGTELAGVAVLDPYVLATLLQYVDPIEVSGFDRPVTARNAAEFIFREQYEIVDQDERADLLEVIARHVTDELLGGALPAPRRLVDDLAPMVDEDRLLFWAADGGLQEVVLDAGMDGGFPTGGDPGQFAFSFNNAGGNKVDAYVDTSAAVRRDVDTEWGDVVVVEVDMINSTPVDSLDFFVVKNRVDLPPGTSYTYVSAYSMLDLVRVERNGRPVAAEFGTELGLGVASFYATVEAGDTATFSFTYVDDDVGDADLSVYLPPLHTR